MSKTKSKYYVYALLDPTKPGTYKYGRVVFNHEPFYVGKGCSNRILNSAIPEDSGSNPFKEYRIKTLNKRKNGTIMLIIKDRLPEKSAYTLEGKLISKIGRMLFEGGPLLNIAPGGGGPGGPHNFSKEKVQKIMRKIDKGTFKGSLDTLVQEARKAFKTKRSLQIKRRWADMTEKERAAARQRNSEGVKRYWASLSKKDRKAHASKLGRRKKPSPKRNKS